MPTVRNMQSPRSGNPVANQFVITTDEGRYFQSYYTTIAFVDNNGKVSMDSEYWNHSRTTSKYRNIFLGTNTDETKEKIQSGEIKLSQLN